MNLQLLETQIWMRLFRDL